MSKPARTRREAIQDQLNYSMMRLAILLERESILLRYKNENLTSTRLSHPENTAIELLLGVARRESSVIKTRRLALIGELEKLPP